MLTSMMSPTQATDASGILLLSSTRAFKLMASGCWSLRCWLMATDIGPYPTRETHKDCNPPLSLTVNSRMTRWPGCNFLDKRARSNGWEDFGCVGAKLQRLLYIRYTLTTSTYAPDEFPADLRVAWKVADSVWKLNLLKAGCDVWHGHRKRRDQRARDSPEWRRPHVRERASHALRTVGDHEYSECHCCHRCNGPQCLLFWVRLALP